MTDQVVKALTIAGSDCGGGAGIQADLKTFQELGVYGMSAITAITAQNTLGVHGVYPMTAEAVSAQLRAIGEDLTPQAVKTGMLFSEEIILEVARQVRAYAWTQLVVDPVMVAKGGAKLLQDQAITAMKEVLLPLAAVVTPNLPEAEVLADMAIRTYEDRKEAARRIHRTGVEVVVIKGGHDEAEQLIDLIYDGDAFIELAGVRCATKNTHGTGCTFSAAVAAGLAAGLPLHDAIRQAKAYIQAAIEDDLHLGSGHGPTNHWAYRRRREAISR